MGIRAETFKRSTLSRQIRFGGTQLSFDGPVEHDTWCKLPVIEFHGIKQRVHCSRFEGPSNDDPLQFKMRSRSGACGKDARMLVLGSCGVE